MLAMLTTYRVVLALHVALGAIALPAFWIAIAARKGSRRHLRAGSTYVLTMSACAALAVALGVLTVIDPSGTHPPNPTWSPAEVSEHAEVTRRLIPSIGFVGLIALSLVHFGWRAPARARPRSSTARALDWAVPGALLAAGVSGLPLGRVPGLEFADGMGLACIVFALPQLAALARAGRRPWILDHLSGLGGAAVIGHVAVFVSIVPRLAPDLWSRDPQQNPIPWLISPLLGIGLLLWGCRYWRRRLADGTAPGSRSQSTQGTQGARLGRASRTVSAGSALVGLVTAWRVWM